MTNTVFGYKKESNLNVDIGFGSATPITYGFICYFSEKKRFRLFETPFVEFRVLTPFWERFSWSANIQCLWRRVALSLEQLVCSRFVQKHLKSRFSISFFLWWKTLLRFTINCKITFIVYFKVNNRKVILRNFLFLLKKGTWGTTNAFL